MTVLLRSLIRVWPAFLVTILVTQFELMITQLKLLRLFTSEKNTQYNLYIIKS